MDKYTKTKHRALSSAGLSVFAKISNIEDIVGRMQNTENNKSYTDLKDAAIIQKDLTIAEKDALIASYREEIIKLSDWKISVLRTVNDEGKQT
ncbi:hypothetical protein ACMFMG_009683 [Clarireedia jacksonii]